MVENFEHRLCQERVKFYEQHKDAHLLVFDERTRTCVGAIYFSIDYEGVKQTEEALEIVKASFSAIKAVFVKGLKYGG